MQALNVPTIVVSANDDLSDVTPRLADIRTDIEIVPIDNYGFGVFEVQAEVLADIARRHFDAEEGEQ